MEVDTDTCSYTLYSIMQEDCNISESGVAIQTVDFDEYGTIYTADSQLLSPPHHFVSLNDSDQISHEDNMLEHKDSGNIVVQDMVEEEVNVQGDTDVDVQNGMNSNDSEKVLNAYVEYVQNVVIYCCYVCGHKFTRLQTSRAHMKRQHGIMCDVSRVTEETLPIATVCRQCGYIGLTQQAMCLHVTQKHLPVARPLRQCKTNLRRLMLNRRRMAAQKAAYPPVMCLICGSKIGLLKNYDGHIKRYHQNDPNFAEAVNDVRRIQFERAGNGNGVIVTCETCGELCNENRLLAHIRWKHGSDKNVKQLMCAARQLIRNSKQQHMATVRSEVVSCPHCGRTLRQISLPNHIKFYCSVAVHAAAAGSAKPSYVECAICGQHMPRPKLYRHRRLVHRVSCYKQIETFVCEFCPREFTEAHQLRTHVKKHTGESVIICLLCYRNFTLNYVYQEHFRRVHCADFRFNCDNCGRGFWKESTLHQHVCVPEEKERNVGKIMELKVKMQQLEALNKSLFVVVSPYKSDAADDVDNGSYVWICLPCKLPFRSRKSYETHRHSKHTTPDNSHKHSCSHCGRRFQQTRQFQLHKCRPENYASNVQKEMQLRSRQHSSSATVEYIGPTFVRVHRHDDILAIVGDIFSHTDNDDDSVVDNTCIGVVPKPLVGINRP